MMRRLACVFVGLLLFLPWPVQAGGEKGLAGNWKITIYQQGQGETPWLLKIEQKDGKWTGSCLSALSEELLKASRLGKFELKGEQLRFTVNIEEDSLQFDIKVPKDGGKVLKGTFQAPNGQIGPVQLERTTSTSVDKAQATFDLNREMLVKKEEGPAIFHALQVVLRHAADKKLKEEDVKAWSAHVLKAAEAYGAAWQRRVAENIALELSQQAGFADLGVEYARRAERLLQANDTRRDKQRVLAVLVKSLKAAKQTEEAKKAEARLEKLSELKPTKFAGRKGKSERVVLVELFTGTQCPPCVAADLAFDGLEKTYSPSEVVGLEYHLHIPAFDPLTNPDTEARVDYYYPKKDEQATPSILFNGKALAPGGGARDAAPEKYDEYRKVIEPLLETSTSVKLKGTAVRKGDKITITAEVADPDAEKDKRYLRIALVEETVNYKGGNGLPAHHHVVRALAGGPKGFRVKDKGIKQTVSIDLAELRTQLAKYLKEIEKDNPATKTDKVLEMDRLGVVLFVQNDETREVLQALQVPIRIEDGKEKK
jgi:hypothetical protein